MLRARTTFAFGIWAAPVFVFGCSFSPTLPTDKIICSGPQDCPTDYPVCAAGACGRPASAADADTDVPSAGNDATVDQTDAPPPDGAGQDGAGQDGSSGQDAA